MLIRVIRGKKRFGFTQSELTADCPDGTDRAKEGGQKTEIGGQRVEGGNLINENRETDNLEIG